MPTPAVIAHRGFAGVAPENTVGAVDRALDDASMVEIDVRPAADGTPVVFHDDRLDGVRNGRPLTDATGLVHETPLEDVRTATVLGSDQTVPTLGTLLETLPSTAALNIELKSPGATDLRVGTALDPAVRDERQAVWTPFVDRVIADCQDFEGELLFSSFCEGAIAAVRDLEPTYAAAPLIWDALEDGLTIADRYDCDAIHPPKSAIAGTGLATEPESAFTTSSSAVDVLERAHEAGRAVNVWTVETWDEFDQLARAGVDGIVAEYPRLDAVTATR